LKVNGPIFRPSEAAKFFCALKKVISRQIEGITVIPLHGKPYDLATISEAIEFVQKYKEDAAVGTPIQRYEVQIRYSNGDLIDGKFTDRESAIAFLQDYQDLYPHSEVHAKENSSEAAKAPRPGTGSSQDRGRLEGRNAEANFQEAPGRRLAQAGEGEVAARHLMSSR
jgi:hypothetical protein